LIFHGYLLRGTGSNVYNASLAQTLARLGHDVHLLCQDRQAASLRWVDDFVDLEDGARSQRGSPPERQAASGEGRTDGKGSITVYVPDIGRLLPVFVLDRYEGFEVKTFPQLKDAELTDYIDANVSAVREVVESLGGVDAAVASHLVMGPVVLARAGLRCALKVHGSDLSYTVLPHLERFRPYALEAAANATAILVSTEHVAARFRLAVDDPRVEQKLRLAPPGVDAELFSPIPSEETGSRLSELAAELDAGDGESAPTTSAPADSWRRDDAQAAAAINHLAEGRGPRILFVGKLIVSKGVDLLLAAWPLVHARHPDARLLIVGFGAYERGLRGLWSALTRGDLAAARRVAQRGRGLEGGEEGPLRILGSFLAEPPGGYLDSARRAASSVSFPGRLEHDEVGRLLPANDALVFPSTFPEAFGMVAAEAAAAGVLPISADHSGAAEVSRALAATLPPQVRDLVSFPLDEVAVEAIADRLDSWLGLAPEIRDVARAALRETAVRLWSWESVARDVLAATAGRLDELRPVPASDACR
jgi:glycosyltransferase involved in cell wall biosynthesis